MDVLNLISEHNLSPDITTFGCLAVACKRPPQIYQMIRDLESYNIVPNVQIMTPLIRSTHEPKLMIKLLKLLQRHNITPDTYLVKCVEQFYQIYNQKIVDYENGTVTNVRSTSIKKEIEAGLPNWTKFCEFYKNWLTEVEITLSEHPWNQYNTKRDQRKYRRKAK